MKMRKSQQQIFWKDHKVIVFTRGGKFSRVYGEKVPKTAQEIINEVSEQWEVGENEIQRNGTRGPRGQRDAILCR